MSNRVLHNLFFNLSFFLSCSLSSVSLLSSRTSLSLSLLFFSLFFSFSFFFFSFPSSPFPSFFSISFFFSLLFLPLFAPSSSVIFHLFCLVFFFLFFLSKPPKGWSRGGVKTLFFYTFCNLVTIISLFTIKDMTSALSRLVVHNSDVYK